MNIQTNPDEHCIRIDQNVIQFTKTEMVIVLELMKNPNKILNNEHFYDVLKYTGDEKKKLNFLHAHIKNIRKKINNTPIQEAFKSIYGKGYRYTPVS